MLYRKFLLSIILFFACLTTRATVFVVTSNADAGVGTLREALTLAAANGNTAKDSVYFNLPDLSVNGRTIILLSDLPAVTSDLIIDGSTQPGNNLSVNGAKIIVQGNYKQSQTQLSYIVYFLIKSVNDFEIDGLIIKGMYSNGFNTGLYGGNAILLDGTSKNITIGQPGKGNVMYDNSQAISCTVGASPLFPNKSQTANLTLKNNLIGVKEDGVTIAKSAQSATTFNNVYNVVIGGDTPAEGNVFYCIFSLSPNYINDQVFTNVFYKIRNNIFGANTLQQRSTDPAVVTSGNQLYANIAASANVSYSISSIIDVRDNVFGCSLSIRSFQNLTLQIQHNFFGTSSNQSIPLPIFASALYLGYMQGTILVGGADLTKGNVFTNAGHDTTTTAKDDPTVWVEDFGPSLSPLFKVELSHNSFYCNRNMPLAYTIYYDKKPIQPLSVDILTPTLVNGTAVPNARVELYYTDLECKQCQPKTFLTTTYADAAGKWSYNGNLLPGFGVMADATLNNLSSEFTDTRIYTGPSYLQVTNAECSSGGSIKGYLTANAKQLDWLDAVTHQVVATGIDLLNAPAGTYILRATQFGCTVYSQPIKITDASPVVISQSMKLINPSCTQATGSISGIFANYANQIDWLDGNNTVIGHQYNISNLPAGSYTLRVIGQRGCVATYGPITLTNTTGPNINQTASIIQGSNCGTSTGSITNIIASGSGTLTYSWKNSQQQLVGTSANLLNQPTGQYILTVTDQSTCGPVSSAAITIPELNGITIDASAKVQTPASCQNNDGTITGIKVTGATNYKWINGTGQTVSTQADLAGAAPGSYYLLATNSTCSAQTAVYTIVRQTNTTDYGGTTKVLINATCDLNNGSIEVIFQNPAIVPVSYRWENSLGQTVGGNSRILTNIDAGMYKLYGTDANGCEKFVVSYGIGRVPALTVVTNTVKLTNDHCQTGTGSIKGIGWAGKAPVSVTWTDGSGTFIANTTDVTNLKAGNYNVKITDGSGCAQALSYTINNMDIAVPLPSVNPVQLCRTGAALIAVNNPSPLYVFKLYDKINDTTPIDQSTSGNFKVSISGNRSYFISQYTGNCESGRTEVAVSVGLTALDIANAITPNGDGNNDSWKIKGIESYPNALVQIFNRNGQLVYDVKGYSTPFDGKFNGQPLPAGAYYYIINLKNNCGLISGSLSILR